MLNSQEKQMVDHKASTTEVMLQSSLMGLLIGIFTSAGALLEATLYMYNNPAAIRWLLLCTTLTFGGMKGIMILMQSEGTVVVSLVTSTRKVVTVLLSFYLFGHQSFHQNHAVGLVLLALGMTLSHLDKSSSPGKEAAAAMASEEAATKSTGSVGDRANIEPELGFMLTKAERRQTGCDSPESII